MPQPVVAITHLTDHRTDAFCRATPGEGARFLPFFMLVTAADSRLYPVCMTCLERLARSMPRFVKTACERMEALNG